MPAAPAASSVNTTTAGWQQKRASAISAAAMLERHAKAWPDGHIPKLRMQAMAKELRDFANIADQWATNVRKLSR